LEKGLPAPLYDQVLQLIAADDEESVDSTLERLDPHV
jgi:hypothetical protein